MNFVEDYIDLFETSINQTKILRLVCFECVDPQLHSQEH
jgi:hypothetical protein